MSKYAFKRKYVKKARERTPSIITLSNGLKISHNYVRKNYSESTLQVSGKPGTITMSVKIGSSTPVHYVFSEMDLVEVEG